MWVDVGRFFVAEGRACWGREKRCITTLASQASKMASGKIAWGESRLEIVHSLGTFITSALNYPHVLFRSVTPPLWYRY
jgi:hypothetical protein